MIQAAGSTPRIDMATGSESTRARPSRTAVRSTGSERSRSNMPSCKSSTTPRADTATVDTAITVITPAAT